MDTPPRGASPSLKAEHYIRQVVLQLNGARREALPGTRQMALDAGVSLVTLTKAARRLCDEGLLRSVPRHGFFVNRGPRVVLADSAPPEGDNALSISGVTHRIATAVGGDILAARYSPGTTLPSFKEMGNRYGCSYRPLKRALDRMAAQGRLASCGRRYRVPELPLPAAHTSLVLVAATDKMDVLGGFTPRASDFWRVLERRCLHLNVKLEVCEFLKVVGARPWPDGKRQTVVERNHSKSVLGYVVLTLGFGVSHLEDALRMLSAAGRPISVIHDNPAMPLDAVVECARRFKRTKVLEFATTPRCARDVGNYLLNLGHRRVGVFLAPFDDACWSMRVRGLQTAYRQSGVTDGIKTYCPSTLRTADDIGLALHNLGLRQDLHALSDQMQRLMGDFEGTYEPSFQHEGTGPDFGRFVIQSNMGQAFARALEDSSITAWVGVNDFFALLAYSFLRQKGISVPRDMTVIGFDDSIDAFGAGLTSYNFNMTAVVDAMVGHLLNTSGESRRSTNVLVEVPGYVISRTTTGTPHRTRNTRL